MTKFAAQLIAKATSQAFKAGSVAFTVEEITGAKVRRAPKAYAASLFSAAPDAAADLDKLKAEEKEGAPKAEKAEKAEKAKAKAEVSAPPAV